MTIRGLMPRRFAAGPAAAAGLWLAVVSPAVAASAAWTVSPAGSRVGFAVEGRFYPVEGRFSDVAGAARFDETDPARAALTLTVGTASIDTGVGVRDDILRGPRVFDAARHARAVFQLTAFEPVGDGVHDAAGTLEWRGVRRAIRLTVRTDEFDPAVGRLRLSGETVISRTAFGLQRTPRLNPIGDGVRIVFSLLLQRQAGMPRSADPAPR